MVKIMIKIAVFRQSPAKNYRHSALKNNENIFFVDFLIKYDTLIVGLIVNNPNF